jgi:hypothetical protein
MGKQMFARALKTRENRKLLFSFLSLLISQFLLGQLLINTSEDRIQGGVMRRPWALEPGRA